MPRLVRKKPLYERITAMLNPMDFLLWLSEEMETRDWDSNLAGTQLGLGFNFVFLLVRANSGSSSSSTDGDIFGDERSSGWVSFLIYPIVWGLVAFSCANAFYALSRTRKYRMFEANIDVTPATPSARRVQVQSSPVSSSPLRYIADMLTPGSAESRAHPNKKRDVWELSVWDPLPISLRLFCLFSPGHVLVYLLFLPLAPMDPQPSITVFNSLVMQILLSGQLFMLSSLYSQQAKDNAIIQKEVMNEYNTKFVHPRIHPVVRDAGTQLSDDQPSNAREFVQVGTPTTLIRNSFATRGNSRIDSESTPMAHSNVMKPQMFTPPTASRLSDSFTPTVGQQSSALRHSLPGDYTPVSTSTNNHSSSTASNTATGGNMGIYNHNRSPLKKAISLNDMHSPAEPASPRNSREMAAYEQRGGRQSSPLKNSDMRRSMGPSIPGTSSSHLFANATSNKMQQQRYPPRW